MKTWILILSMVSLAVVTANKATPATTSGTVGKSAGDVVGQTGGVLAASIAGNGGGGGLVKRNEPLVRRKPVARRHHPAVPVRQPQMAFHRPSMKVPSTAAIKRTAPTYGAPQMNRGYHKSANRYGSTGNQIPSRPQHPYRKHPMHPGNHPLYNPAKMYKPTAHFKGGYKKFKTPYGGHKQNVPFKPQDFPYKPYKPASQYKPSPYGPVPYKPSMYKAPAAPVFKPESANYGHDTSPVFKPDSPYSSESSYKLDSSFKPDSSVYRPENSYKADAYSQDAYYRPDSSYKSESQYKPDSSYNSESYKQDSNPYKVDSGNSYKQDSGSSYSNYGTSGFSASDPSYFTSGSSYIGKPSASLGSYSSVGGSKHHSSKPSLQSPSDSSAYASFAATTYKDGNEGGATSYVHFYQSGGTDTKDTDPSPNTYTYSSSHHHDKKATRVNSSNDNIQESLWAGNHQPESSSSASGSSSQSNSGSISFKAPKQSFGFQPYDDDTTGHSQSSSFQVSSSN